MTPHVRRTRSRMRRCVRAQARRRGRRQPVVRSQAVGVVGWCITAHHRCFGTIGREQEHRHGALVGRDSFGNTYYENRHYMSSAADCPGRHSLKRSIDAARSGADRERWVMYADKNNYSAKEVPPDWHGAT